MRAWLRRLLVLALALAPGHASAQASLLLPPDHWAVRAAARAEALGLASEYLPAQAAVPRAAVADALRGALAAARDPRQQELFADWYARLIEEFPELAAGSPPARLGGAVGVAYERAAGLSAPGLGLHPPAVTGALPLQDRQGWGVGLDLWGRLAPPLVVAVSPVLGEDGLDVPRWEAAVALGRWGLSAGRGAVGYGFARGGGVVLSEHAPLDLVQLASVRPFRFPGLLRYLGPSSIHTFVSRLPEERHPGSPYLWGASGQIRPHPRVTLAIHRAAMIGGSEVEEHVSVRELAGAFIGILSTGVDQIVSGEARLRLPTEAWLPATVYCEWGAEDAAGAVLDVPGILCGSLLSAPAGLPEVAAGVEFAHFSPACCYNPAWYRHWAFPGSWALDEAPLGHPLGGEGSEWMGFLQASAWDARLQMEGRAFRRERSGENLFVPGRDGNSLGLAAGMVLRFHPASEVRLAAARERGESWAETRLSLSSRLLF